MRKKNNIDLKILKKLCEIYSPSGYENNIMKYLKSLEFKNFKFSVTKKKSGLFTNITKINNSNEVIILDAHIDQVHMKQAFPHQNHH